MKNACLLLCRGFLSYNPILPLALTIFVAASALALPAFPGAEGFGAETPGGRGGTVVEVTNLNDTGPGSFRAACATSGPRIIVFRVNGTISVQSEIAITEPFVTIAGQTAPGAGVTIKTVASYDGPALMVQTHDVVVRYLRFRLGKPTTLGCCGDNVELGNGNSNTAYNIIFDHCSFSWGNDELVDAWYQAHDITWQWCIFSEALAYVNYDSLRPYGKGPLFGDRAGRITFRHNLLAHNIQRNPQFTGIGRFDMINNYVYDWAHTGTCLYEIDGIPEANIIGNYYKAGPSDCCSGTRYELAISAFTANSMVYVSDNIGPHRPNSSMNEWAIVGDLTDSPSGWLTNPADAKYQKSSPWPGSTIPVTVQPVMAAAESVLAHAGASLDRDLVDSRIINEVRNGTGTIIEDPAEVGGWPVLALGNPPTDTDHDGMPDAWENSNGLNSNSAVDGILDKDSDGYTNIEEYLNQLAGNNQAPAITPRALNPKKDPGLNKNPKECPLDIFGRVRNNDKEGFKGQNMVNDIMDRKFKKASQSNGASRHD